MASEGPSGRAPRLLLIALDSLPPALLGAMMQEGLAPNLARLRARGKLGPVASDAGLFPGGVWPAFFTGRDVSHHGIYHVSQWDGRSQHFRSPGPDWLPAPAFWDSLAASGIRVITLDVPFAAARDRPPAVTEVLGWGVHEALWAESRPAGLLAELNRRHGRSSQQREVPGPRPAAAYRRELDGLVADVARRASIVEDLASRFDWRLMIVCFTETHRAGHWYWDGRATGEPQGGLKQVVRAIDQVLPRLERLIGPDDQIGLFSLHGMGPKSGFDRFGHRIADYIEPASESLARRLDPVTLLRGGLPAAVRRALVRAMPRPTYSRLVDRYTNAGRDWSRMRTIVNPLDHLLYVTSNLEGDPGAEAKEWHLAAAEARLKGVTTPEGIQVAESFIRPAQRYSGPRLDILPDLIVDSMAGPYGRELVTAEGLRLQAEQRTWQDGDHLPAGFYLQAGPGIAAGSSGPLLRVEDLARSFSEAAGLAVEPAL